MTTRALIVEDDPYIADSFKDVLELLEHEAEIAGTLKEARDLLRTKAFTYAILDMAIPLEPGKLPQREMGRQLLEEIRRTPPHAELPVLVVTGEDHGDSDFIRSVMRAGGYDLPKMDYLQKITVQLPKGEVNFEVMTKRITGLLSARPGAVPATPPQKPTKAFSDQPRRLTIYRHRIDVCGVQLWSETESPDMRTAMMNLNRRDGTGRFRAFRGEALVPGRNVSNPVGAMIERFRKSATVRLREDRDLECGSQDIVATERRKGYFFQEWVTVEVVDADGPADDQAPATSALCQGGFGAAPAPASNLAPATAPGAHELPPFAPTERQRNILSMLGTAPMTQKELLAKIKVGKSTLNRDLAIMRDKGLFTTDSDKRYILTDAGRTCLG